MGYQEVGRVVKPCVYPVKGMQGIKMEQVSARSVSLVGDRRVAFVITDSTDTPNFLDTTKFPGLLRYKTRFENPTRPKDSEIIVTTPDGIEQQIGDPLLLQQISDESHRKLTLLSMGRGAYHSMPVSLLGEETVSETSRLAGVTIDAQVFRENLYVTTCIADPYVEDTWLDHLLFFGKNDDSAVLAVTKLDTRCATVNMHPETGEQEPAILKAIVRYHHNTLGVYCSIVKDGFIRAGSPIYSVPLSH